MKWNETTIGPWALELESWVALRTSLPEGTWRVEHTDYASPLGYGDTPDEALRDWARRNRCARAALIAAADRAEGLLGI